MAGAVSGWSTSDRIPRVVFALQFGQGPHSGLQTDYALFVGQRAYDGAGTPQALGTATDTQPDACYSAEDAGEKWGYGSEIHRIAIGYFGAYPGAPAYAVSAAKGAEAIRASKDLVLTVPPTEGGTMTLEIAGIGIDVYLSASEALDVIGADIAAACTRADLPVIVTYAGAGDTLTLTSKCYGPSGNAITFRAYNLPGGFTLTPSSGVLASGAVEPSWSAAYAAAFALDTVFYHIVPATNVIATLNTGTGNLRDRISANVAPTVGKLSDVFTGATGSLASAQTINDGLDLGTTDYDEPSYWFRLAWAKSNSVEPWFLAAQFGGTEAFAEAVDAVQNWIGLEGGPMLKLIPPTPLVSNYPTDAELNDAIATGVSPCYYSHKQAATKVCTAVTSKHLIGSANDPNYVEHPNITAVCRAVSYGVRSTLAAAYSGFSYVANDEEGGVPDNIGPKQVCPREVTEKLLTIMKQDYQSGPRHWVQNVEAHRAETSCSIADSPAGRLLYDLPIDVPRWVDAIGGMHREVGRQ